MNIKEIKEILQLMKDHGLAEVEIEKDGLKLKLKKNGANVSYVDARGESASMVIPFPKAEASESKGTSKPAVEEVNDAYVARSPMVGTFYASPAPDQPPYASVGKTVKPGDVLCIIEAMKLMNEIKCEVNGVVTEVLITNGQAVEFDQPLFKIKKA